MNTLLVAINSKYIHSNLAVRYIKACCSDTCGNVTVAEYTINESIESILQSIHLNGADVVAFSCYIWNIDYVLKLSDDIKKIKPETLIILGGPEVSHTPGEILSQNSSVDYILAGETEISFSKLLQCLNGKGEHGAKVEAECIADIPGLHSRSYANGFCVVENLDELPSPYIDEMLKTIKGKIVYFEASRGCPFSCSYCLSSTIPRVRYFSIDRVKKELERLISSGARQIKFVDRTFNASKSRSQEIFRFIMEKAKECERAGNPLKMNFHFEAYPDLLTDDTIELLSQVPPGLIQLECGIQSTNEDTLKAVGRKTDTAKALQNIEKVIKAGNIHMHVDLVAGLPHEDLESFKGSFNSAYSIKPNNIQLGFLKLLKGTEMRNKSGAYGYLFREYPPYEILKSDAVSFDELCLLKDAEEILERYYNSGRFDMSLRLFEVFFPRPFDFFEKFSGFCRKHGYLQRPQSSESLYTIMLQYLDSIWSHRIGFRPLLIDLMKFDFLRSHVSSQLPVGIDSSLDKEFSKSFNAFLHQREKLSRYLPGKSGRLPKEILKSIHYELFSFDVKPGGDMEPLPEKEIIVFDLECKDPVTGHFKYCVIPLREIVQDMKD